MSSDTGKLAVTGSSFVLVLLTFASGGILAGGASLLLYMGLCKRKQVDAVDGALGLFSVIADAFGGVAEMVQDVPKVADEAQKIVKGQKPILPSFQQLKQQNDDKAIAIKRENLLRSAILVAPQGSGKTRYLLDDVQAFFEFDGGELFICDPNYGSSHNGEPPNTWFDLPLDEFVFVQEQDCLDVIKKMSGVVDARQKENLKAAKSKSAKPHHNSILLLVDEESMINGFIGEDQDLRNEFVGWIRNLLQRGAKQNVFIKLVCHDTTTATTGLPQALFAQVDVILLGAAAIHDKYLSQCGIDKTWASEVKELRKTNERAYVAKINGNISVNPMPFIPEPTLVFEVDDSGPWRNEWLTDERIEALEALPDDARIIDDIAVGVFGLSRSRCRNENPDYVNIKEVWAKVLEKRESGNSAP